MWHQDDLALINIVRPWSDHMAPVHTYLSHFYVYLHANIYVYTALHCWSNHYECTYLGPLLLCAYVSLPITRYFYTAPSTLSQYGTFTHSYCLHSAGRSWCTSTPYIIFLGLSLGLRQFVHSVPSDYIFLHINKYVWPSLNNWSDHSANTYSQAIFGILQLFVYLSYTYVYIPAPTICIFVLHLFLRLLVYSCSDYLGVNSLNIK